LKFFNIYQLIHNFSFVQEFVGDPLDGVTLLLEILRAVQLSQTTQKSRIPPAIARRALLDEHECLQCLQNCVSRSQEGALKLATSSAGLFTIAVGIMSNVTKSRVLALQVRLVKILITKFLMYTTGSARLEAPVVVVIVFFFAVKNAHLSINLSAKIFYNLMDEHGKNVVADISLQRVMSRSSPVAQSAKFGIVTGCVQRMWV
jgi:hypothetical protein